MIYVLADDFTGAAESAAVGLRHGFRCQVHTLYKPDATADLVSLDTDSRGMTQSEAGLQLGKIGSRLAERKQLRIFKKVDSVLRGSVLSEITSLAEALDRTRILLIPANPSLDRVVREGRYFIGDQPIESTDFARDPEYPVRSSGLVEMLRAGGLSEQVHLSKPGSVLPQQGILIGDVETQNDLSLWANVLDAETLPAGGAEFLAACLSFWDYPPTNEKPSPPELDSRIKTLFISGSSSSYSRKISDEFAAIGIPVHRMPPALLKPSNQEESLIASWSSKILDSLERSRFTRISIDLPLQEDPKIVRHLSNCLLKAVETVLRADTVDHVCVEGGGTVSALARRFGWSELEVVMEWTPGVVTLQRSDRTDVLLTTKPGSYTWPEKLLPL